MTHTAAYLVTLATDASPQHVIRVSALNKADAAYRAADRAERDGAHVLRVVRVLPTR